MLTFEPINSIDSALRGTVSPIMNLLILGSVRKAFQKITLLSPTYLLAYPKETVSQVLDHSVQFYL